MQRDDKITGDAKAVKPPFDYDLIAKEIGPERNGVGTPFYFWLYQVKRVDGRTLAERRAHAVTPELWAEWHTVKESYLAECAAECAKRDAKAKAQQEARDAAERAAAAARAKRNAERAVKEKALQIYALLPIRPEPVDYEQVHELRKRPEQSKRRLAQRWLELFKTKSEAVQAAHRAFHEIVTINLPSAADADADADDDDDNDGGSGYAIDAPWLYLQERPPGKRNLDDDLDLIATGLRDPEFEKFRHVTARVRRLLDEIGNPIDDAITPAAGFYQPEPPLDLDAIADDPAMLAHVVPGLIPRGWTIPHGDPGACKSLWVQKLAIVLADKDGATFEGIEVEHGEVILASQDPSASPKEIKPGMIEIRARLGLQASGRLHLSGVPLILNEPTSVDHWIAMHKARLPCKVIIVDSLFSTTAGSLALDIVVKGVRDGVMKLLRYADAVVTVHHDNKSGDIFGSQYLVAMLAGKIAFVRSTLKDGRPGGHVTVTVERIKRPALGHDDAAALKLAYRLDGPLLGLGEGAGESDADALPVRRPDILAVLPTTPAPLGNARKLIEHMLTGKTPKSRDEEWRRLRLHWAERGVVIVKDGTIRRVE